MFAGQVRINIITDGAITLKDFYNNAENSEEIDHLNTLQQTET